MQKVARRKVNYDKFIRVMVQGALGISHQGIQSRCEFNRICLILAYDIFA